MELLLGSTNPLVTQVTVKVLAFLTQHLDPQGRAFAIQSMGGTVSLTQSLTSQTPSNPPGSPQGGS